MRTKQVAVFLLMCPLLSLMFLVDAELLPPHGGVVGLSDGAGRVLDGAGRALASNCDSLELSGCEEGEAGEAMGVYEVVVGSECGGEKRWKLTGGDDRDLFLQLNEARGEWVVSGSCERDVGVLVFGVAGAGSDHGDTFEDGSHVWHCLSPGGSWSDNKDEDIADLRITCQRPCADDPNFLDPWGYNCQVGWEGYDCYLADVVWGLSQAELYDLLSSCPITCGTCGGEYTLSTATPTQSSTSAPTPSTTSQIVSVSRAPTSSPTSSHPAELTASPTAPTSSLTCDEGSGGQYRDENDGLCRDCPEFHFAPPGSTSSEHCILIGGDLFVLSFLANAVDAFSNDERTFKRVVQDIEFFRGPRDILFISPTRFLVSFSPYATLISGVLEFDIDGNYIGVFAHVSDPHGMIKHPSNNWVGIACTCDGMDSGGFQVDDGACVTW